MAPLAFAEPPLDNKFNFRPFTISEVHKALMKLDSKKTTGPDNIVQSRQSRIRFEHLLLHDMDM